MRAVPSPWLALACTHTAGVPPAPCSALPYTPSFLHQPLRKPPRAAAHCNMPRCARTHVCTLATRAQLAHAGQASRAWELFNGLRALRASGSAGGLAALLDVFSYTAMISLCANGREVGTAQELSQEMAALGVERNVHTFSGARG